MEIIIKGIEEIRPYENNPRVNDGAVGAVAESIREFGFQQPIVVDRDGVIIAGHTRYKAAKKLGLTEVPVVVAGKLTDEQVRAYRLADNKTGELAEWDFSALEEELAGIGELDMSLFGFDNFEEVQDVEPIDQVGSTTAAMEHKMMIDKQTIGMTEEEYAEITEKLERYVDLNGVSFGFVRSLLHD